MTKEHFRAEFDNSYSGHREEAIPGTVSTGQIGPSHGSQVWDGSAWVDPQDYIDKQWTKTVADKKKEAEAAYSSKIDAGFNYQSNNYDLNKDSVDTVNNFMTGLIAQNANPHGGYYRTSDNVNVSMNDAELIAFITAFGLYYGSLRPVHHTNKDAIAAATTQVDLDAIDLEAGWPLNDG